MSQILLRKGPFIYRTIFPEIEDQALTLLAHEHVKYEPIDAYLNTSEEACKQFFFNSLSEEKSKELSIVCIHEPTQELCGISINNSADPEIIAKTSDSASIIGPLYKILEDLSEEFLENNKKRLKHGMFITGVAVPKK